MANWQELLIDLAVIGVFIAGIALFRTPRGARRGNGLTAAAFAAAVALLVYRTPIGSPLVVVATFLAGGVVGWLVSARISMTRIPALIALQNGAGGGASLLVSSVELYRMGSDPDALSAFFGVAGALVGGVALSGSLVAAAKLENRIDPRPKSLPAHNLVMLAMLAAVAALAFMLFPLGAGARFAVTAVLGLVTLAVGVVLAMRVGGADMPVMISLLNAFSGLAAAFVGVAVRNQMLVAAGAMVGSSGTILTLVMARAMNRGIGAILVGRQVSAGTEGAPVAGDTAPEVARAASSEPPLRRARAALAAATSVIIVPGYGMALAQAQEEVAALAAKLEAAGKLVRFAVHPVAGRMPGHMHVLLAEANVDYDKLYEMDAINDQFAATDVALIVGASDVVNPAAIGAADTPISGMPILNAHEAHTIIVCNLDAKPGYSGVQNPLYDDPKTILLFGDAKETVASLMGGHA